MKNKTKIQLTHLINLIEFIIQCIILLGFVILFLTFSQIIVHAAITAADGDNFINSIIFTLLVAAFWRIICPDSDGDMAIGTLLTGVLVVINLIILAYVGYSGEGLVMFNTKLVFGIFAIVFIFKERSMFIAPFLRRVRLVDIVQLNQNLKMETSTKLQEVKKELVNCYENETPVLLNNFGFATLLIADIAILTSSWMMFT